MIAKKNKLTLVGPTKSAKRSALQDTDVTLARLTANTPTAKPQDATTGSEIGHKKSATKAEHTYNIGFRAAMPESPEPYPQDTRGR